jgi:hypothetical protein
LTGCRSSPVGKLTLACPDRAPAPVGRAAGGPTARPLRGFPAVLGAGRPPNNSPSNVTERFCSRLTRSSNSIWGTPLRGATFQPLRSSASHTGRRLPCPQGLLQQRGVRPGVLRALGHCDALLAAQARKAPGKSAVFDESAAVGLVVEVLGDGGRCGVAGWGPVCAAEERRHRKVAPRSGVRQMLFEHRAWRRQDARWCSRASYLPAFRCRAPQGTPEGGKQSGPQPATPHRPA